LDVRRQKAVIAQPRRGSADRRCPTCLSYDHRALCEVAGYTVWRCPSCASDFVWPMPDDATLHQLYDREAWFEGGEIGGYEAYDAQTDPTLALFDQWLAELGDEPGRRSILDIGCGYGSHLARAADRGWKCFGVEPSRHARTVAGRRHGHRLFIVEDVKHLVPHEFDVVLMLDVLEHMKDPYPVFFELFGKGAITDKTRVLITTPNARSGDALARPERWKYRHPPSHLVNFSARSLVHLLGRLRFTDIAVAGLYAVSAGSESAGYPDEGPSQNDALASYEGLLCRAQGSDFVAFMRERYVPGTWSKLAEYEHVPRYTLAAGFTHGKRVLDFGCGTGYGSALLAAAAESVLGVDIDEGALQWARGTHRGPNITFERRTDLGAALPASSFDVITCFEMIEHVTAEVQEKLVTSLAHVLTPPGLLFISTPNPVVSRLYGENPYHYREMNEDEFASLLRAHFEHVIVLRQFVHPTISFEPRGALPGEACMQDFTGTGAISRMTEPVAFLAVCSRAPLPRLSATHLRDAAYDFVSEYLESARTQDAIQLERYRLGETASQLVDLRARLQTMQDENRALKETRLRLARLIREEPLSWRKVVEASHLVGAIVTPSIVKSGVRRLRNSRWLRTSHPDRLGQIVEPYRISVAGPVESNRPRVVHIIANFMTGGSSRLVVDLVEHLGRSYEHEVVTSYCPDPPAYVGLPVHQLRPEEGRDTLVDYLRRFSPDLVHVHYWGDADQPWYAWAFAAAETCGCAIIENINTPVEPHRSPAVRRYVYVSAYVWRSFGNADRHATVIYPGSDYPIFTGTRPVPRSADCIGMVYRLEPDKLNEHSIGVFIKVLQSRADTRALIVGGGTYLKPYRSAVRRAGLADRVTFTGYVPYRQLPALYERMSIFVAPVWKESFGQVVPFAMNMGVPVVGYSAGALPEIIDDPSLLAPVGDAQRLASIILRLLDDPDARERIALRNRQQAQQRFSVASMIDSYAKIYREVLAGAL
jgi:glycosyltransferase involved in cell wall biosynthesis/2-polyprenyl-3-methyl-5-hydroxy-6-metoxy-1,4-benzoquinol methylase